jgi:hypothetical protein
MKKHLLLLMTVFLCITVNGQTKKVIQKTVQLIEQRNIHLNGGNAAAMSPGKKSRIFIQIDLPPNTVEWYYSFSTSNNHSSIDNLNLFLQFGGLIITSMTPIGNSLTSSGIADEVLSQIKIPYGSHAIDAYLCDRTNIDKFIEKLDNWGGSFKYIIKGSTENTTQGLVRVNNITSGTWYIGLRNPSLTNAVDIIIEAVAIINREETIQPTEEHSKGELYGNMGWKSFERGDYDKCLELSHKAIQLDSTLVWVKFNISLTYLVQEKSEYLDNYIDAISSCRKSENPKKYLQVALKDIYDSRSKLGLIKNSDDIIELINEEFKRYK